MGSVFGRLPHFQEIRIFLIMFRFAMFEWFFFVLGLAVGSFVTVLTERYDEGETVVRGRSRCNHCRKKIFWFDNIPLLSFFMLGGRCRHCRRVIGWRYPLTEFLTGVSFLALAWGTQTLDLRQFLGLIIPAGIFALLIGAAVYDWRTMRIPMLLVYWSLALGLLFQVWRYLFFPEVTVGQIWLSLLGGVVAFGALYLLSLVSDERWMGYGDAYVAAVGGLLVGLPAVVYYLTLAFGLGALVGLLWLVVFDKTLRTAVPFAPFLAVAAIVGFLWPQFYLRLFEGFFQLIDFVV
ncbi:MAG TPA: prepilin peptidase [Candidatus Moranbacteria bacterium]|nr:prepilin peptidase [Candidatus Moranbacteria bacterium]